MGIPDAPVDHPVDVAVFRIVVPLVVGLKTFDGEKPLIDAVDDVLHVHPVVELAANGPGDPVQLLGVPGRIEIGITVPGDEENPRFQVHLPVVQRGKAGKLFL